MDTPLVPELISPTVCPCSNSHCSFLGGAGAISPADGRRVRRVMQLALKSAGLLRSDIQYVNAHANSTLLGDRAEAQAIADAFGECAEKLLVSSTKPMTGHLLGGAGSLEAGITVLALRDQIAPPTNNIETLHERGKLKLVRDQGLSTEMEFAMTNSFGFGGTNASLIFQRWQC